MVMEVWWREARTEALVWLEEEEGQGGPRGTKRPNRPVDRLGH
jgi:hypothetical protein